MNSPLPELIDELRITMGEEGHLSPDQFKSKYGRCPIGYNTDPATNRCQKVSLLKSPGGHGVSSPAPKSAPASSHADKKPSSPSASAAPAKATEPKTEPEKAKAAAPAHGAEGGKSEHGFLHRALHHVWDALTDPFKKGWKLIRDKKYRTEVKDFVVKAAKKEGSETKAMASTIAKALRGEKVTKEERNAALHQAADIIKMAVIAGTYGNIASHGIAELAAAIASPADEIVGMMLDPHIRRITKHIFGKEHGILPSAFYEKNDESTESFFRRFDRFLTEAYKEGDEYKVIEQMVDAVLAEMGKTDLDDKTIMQALVKSGLTHKKKGLIDKVISIFSKKHEGKKEPCGKCGGTDYDDIRGKLGDCCMKKESLAARMRALL